MTVTLAARSTRRKARIAGVFYLLTFLTGSLALAGHTPIGAAAGPLAAMCYLVVTAILYELFKPVSRPLSLLAACVSLAGIIAGPAGITIVNPLVLFGCYCLLIGYLILASTLLPPLVGVLMLGAGLGWLTFLWPPLATALYPFNFAPGIIGEGALTLSLLTIGSRADAWDEKVHGLSRMQI